MRVTQNTYSLTVGSTYRDAVKVPGEIIIGEPELAAIGSYDYCVQVARKMIRYNRETFVSQDQTASGEPDKSLVIVTKTQYTKHCYIVEDMRYVAIEE